MALVLDNSGSHIHRQVQWPAGRKPVRLPADSPELNPAERLFEAVREALANPVCASRDALEQHLTGALRP
jgi:hypothetical protein